MSLTESKAVRFFICPSINNYLCFSLKLVYMLYDYNNKCIITILFYTAGLLHGDMGQGDRDEVITSFKKQVFPILVATDVAGQ